MFPWFNAGEPVLWWCPDPRMVLACEDFKVSHSLGKKLRQMQRQEKAGQEEQASALLSAARPRSVPRSAPIVTTNLAFEAVMAACAAPHGQRQHTWIGPSIRQAYTAWHAAGEAHSVEVWQRGERRSKLMGGLYGVCLGRMFFGESMFSRASDASKLALAYLVARLRHLGIAQVDCQQHTAHLASLGARPMPRADFLDLLACAAAQPTPVWGQGRLLAGGALIEASLPGG